MSEPAGRPTAAIGGLARIAPGRSARGGTAFAATLPPDAPPPTRGHGRTRPFRLGATFVADPQPQAEPGFWLGAQQRYQVVRFLGQGGMGRVYEARRESDGRAAALKVLRADRVADNKAEIVARFRQEVTAASRVKHPGIVGMLGFEKTPDGQVIVAMELLQGETLEDWLAGQGTLDIGLGYVAQLCDALHAAHEQGVLHRDIKPANLFLHRDPGSPAGTVQPTILDFGLAKLEVSDHTQIETAAGTVLGTPYYLAPERALGKPLDRRADLYSVGVVLYEMVTGSLPFDADAFMAILEGHVRLIPLDPRQAAPERPIPAAVSALVLSLLAKDPQDRPATAADVARALRELLRTEAEALAQCPTGPRAKAATEAETRSIGEQALGPTVAPNLGPNLRSVHAVASPDAATVAPGASMAFAPAPSPELASAKPGRGWVLVATVVGVAALGLFAVSRSSDDPPAAATPAPLEGAAPIAQPAPPPEPQPTPAASAQPQAGPKPVESVVAVPKPAPTAPEPVVSAKRAGSGTTPAKKKRPRTRPDKPAPPPSSSSLPNFKDDVYGD